jgi:hypothetical protein
VPESKVIDYLLAPTRPDGWAKAAFFVRFGFARDAPGVLASALLHHAAANDVAVTMDTSHGTKYTVEGPLACPDGRRPWVRAVWIVPAGEVVPRLLTACPTERRRSG